MYGSDRVLLETVIWSVRAGAEVLVFVPQEGPLVDALRDAGATVTVVAMFVLRKRLLRPGNWGHLIGSAASGWHAARAAMITNDPSVVYVNTITIPIWTIVARLRRIPVAVHVHEAERTAPALVRAVLYLPLFLARSVIVNSRFSAAAIGSVFSRMARQSRLIYNGVAGPHQVVPPRTTLEGPVRLLFVGRLSPRKGPDLLVEAAEILRSRGVTSEVDLVGDVFPGYEWFGEKLHNDVTVRSLTGQVRFNGFSDDVWPAISAADIVIIPSRLDEPFGNTAVEAVLGARPTVVADTSGLREASQGFASAIRVPASDAGAIADAVERMMRDWPRLREAALDDAVTARARFAPSRYGAEVVAELRSTVDGNRQ